MLETKDQISTVIKEYDAIRKEVDENTDSIKTRVFPIILALVGGFLAWSGKIPLDVAVLFIPSILIMIFANVVNAYYLLDRAGRGLASVENKVFKISGLPLLSHETILVYERSRRRLWTWPLRGIVGCVLYWACEVYLYLNISPEVRQRIAAFPAYRWVILAVVILPSLHYLFYCLEIYKMRRVRFYSSLLESLLKTNFEHSYVLVADNDSRVQGKVDLSEKVPQSIHRQLTQSDAPLQSSEKVLPQVASEKGK